jgi:limonene-1,2-epoxide hydrolase
MSEANIETIVAFIAAWNANDLEAIMGYFAPDAVYHNIPMEAVQGLVAIRDTLIGFAGMSEEIDWELHHIAAAGGAVLTERTDGFKIGGKWIRVRVMGVFELVDGKIAAWRDYFDLAQFQSQIAG